MGRVLIHEVDTTVWSEVVIVIEASFPVVELGGGERDTSGTVREDGGRTTIEPFPGADFDCAPSICVRTFMQHRDSTLLATHLVK